jgi:tRNA pseudouridine55 synthase
MNFEEGEILLVNKPLTWTSFDVVNKIRHAIQKKIGKKIKVGHAGTLDPLATGLLIICTGKRTKQVDELTGLDKEYTGTFYIGATTTTYDSEGPRTEYPAGHINPALIIEAAKKFLGEQDQIPPAHSAIKIDGAPAYLKARKGKAVEMKARRINIKEFELTKIELPEVHFRVVCTKGTYIRSLAYDFGKALNSGAYLASLTRTKVGKFDLKDAWELEVLILKIQES